MAKKKQPATQIFSIFNASEAAAAGVIAERHPICEVIPFYKIPPSVQTNEVGRKAAFAIVIPGKWMQEFKDEISRFGGMP